MSVYYKIQLCICLNTFIIKCWEKILLIILKSIHRGMAYLMMLYSYMEQFNHFKEEYDYVQAAKTF